MSPRFRNAIIIVVLVAFAIAALGGYAIFGPNTPAFEEQRGVKIPPGSSFTQTLDSLQASGVLGSAGTFGMLARATGWKDQIKAGYYEFEAGASNFEILNTLRRGLQTPIRMRIPGGTRLERIADVGGREMAFGPEAFLEALQSDSVAATLGIPREDILGVLLPDTYFFYWLTPPTQVVKKIKDAFDAVIAKNGPPPDGLSPMDVATLASIVEWETAHDEEKPRVAGVYLNRLRIGMPLQADPTVQFGVQEIEGQKRALLYRDYQLAHPYNTYRFGGLPPGPITNPSVSSIKAVLKPEQHDYLYFVASAALDGTHAFSKTLPEHNRKAEAYRRAIAEVRARRAAETPES